MSQFCVKPVSRLSAKVGGAGSTSGRGAAGESTKLKYGDCEMDLAKRTVRRGETRKIDFWVRVD